MSNAADLAKTIIQANAVPEAMAFIDKLRDQPRADDGRYLPSSEQPAEDEPAQKCLDCGGDLAAAEAPGRYRCNQCGLVWEDHELRPVDAPEPEPAKPAKGPSMKQRQKELAETAASLAGDLDTKRWELAALAARAKSTKIDGWAIVIGAAVRRVPRTIRMWAQTWEWVERMACLRYAEQLDFSFFQTAEAYSDRVSERDLLGLLRAYAEDNARTVDEFRTQLADMAGKPPEDLPKKLRKASEKYYGMVDAAPKEVGEQLKAAALALSLAAELQLKHDLEEKAKADQERKAQGL